MIRRVTIIAAIVAVDLAVLACHATRRISLWLARRDHRRINRELAAARRCDYLAWRDFVRHHPLSHPYVKWDHCDECYRTFEHTWNGEDAR